MFLKRDSSSREWGYSFTLWILFLPILVQAQSLHSPSPALCKADFNSTFRDGALEVSFGAGAGFGQAAFGSKQRHDLAITTLEFGWVFKEMNEFCLPGSWELVGETILAHQTHPKSATLGAFSPILRYNFFTNARLVPFVNIGAGIAYTDIGEPDLGSKFEFISQGGFGVHCLLKENLGLTLQYRFSHISNAGIRWPNRGVNNHLVLAGITYLF